MRLLEIEIENIRGISETIRLQPDGKNLVIWGPNGSGKSAVVDALDFLLSGKISRLTGEGTAGISQIKHGSHIKHQPDQAVVKVKFQLPGVGDPVWLKRSFNKPDDLIYDEKLERHVKRVIDFARRGQHVLTRREILKYITSRASTRAEEIQELLNISDVEETRKALVKVNNDLHGELESAKRNVELARSQINSTTQMDSFDNNVVLQIVNSNREILQAEPIKKLRSVDLRAGVKPVPDVSDDHRVNVTIAKRDINNFREGISQEQKALLLKQETELRSLLTEIKADPDMLVALKGQTLIRQGLGLIDESGRCPLCEKSWPKGELKIFLERRLSNAERAGKYHHRINQIVEDITRIVNRTMTSGQSILNNLKTAKLEEEIPLMELWVENLKQASVEFGNVKTNFVDPSINLEKTKPLESHTEVIEFLEIIENKLKEKYPETTPEQTAWDTLVRLEENLKALEKAELECERSRILFSRSDILLQSFIESRDAVLKKLYESIKDRFVEFYKELHGPDEDEFSAVIEPDKAGLK